MKVIAIIALLFCGALAQEGPQCQAPNGGGLAPVLKELKEMLPVEQALEILLTYMTADPETQAVMEYLSSADFHQIVILVQSQASFKSLLSFACNDLYVDAVYYFNLLSGIFGFPEVRTVKAARMGGFRQMLLDLLAILPVDQMQAYFEEKLATDYYVQLAIQKINSDEFGIIIETLQSNAAYNDMKNRLRGYGVDVDLVLDTINKIFKP